MNISQITIGVTMLVLSGACHSTHAQLQHPPPVMDTASDILDEKQLLANPPLFSHILNQAIHAHDIDSLSVLTPLYQQLSSPDWLLYYFAQSVLATHQGDWQQAIDNYQKILAINPDLTPVRIHLSQAYLQQKQHKHALSAINLALQDGALPSDIRQMLTQQKHALTAPQWQFNAWYLSDDNINNAPKQTQHGNWSAPTAQQGRGVSYQVSINQPMAHHHFNANLQLQNFGKYYWDNTPYNDQIYEVKIGIQPVQLPSVHLYPFYQRRYFGQQGYAHHLGLDARWHKPLTPQWHATLGIKQQYHRHDQRHFLDGHLWSAQGKLHHKGDIDWSLGTQIARQHTKDPSESYHDYQLSLDIHHHWHDWHAAHQFTLGKRFYQDADIFAIKRQDTSYHSEHRLWHSRLHYQGYTPSLNFTYDRRYSNHFLFNHQKYAVFIAINKPF